MTALELSALRGRVAAIQRWLTAIYRIDLPLRADRFLLSPESVRALLPAGSPRSGLAVVEERDELWLGLYLDPRDHFDSATLIEETSHWVCLAWHAARGRPISRLLLELQSEVDRYAVTRLCGRDGFQHFRGFRWADGMDASTRQRYETAHRTALRYCRSLARRFPTRSHVPGLLSELRAFYRASREQKLLAGLH